jgi:hypothetical protein
METKTEQNNQENTLNTLKCATLDGINAKVISVEATFTKGYLVLL